jgi:hypothetical protein
LSVKDGQETVDTTNVAYEVTGTGIPGRPRDQRLVLRKTSHVKEVLDEIGMEAATTIEAWPLGVDLKQKPLYALKVAGVDARIVNDVIVISRGLEEVRWWSVYTLGDGAHLFDTYVPLLELSVGSVAQELRYVGLEAPPDDASDPRLRAPNVVGVVTYSSSEHVIREALITCEKRDLAQLLRSYADTTRKATINEHRSIMVTFSPNSPSPATDVTVSIPIAKDDLDVAHATVPAGLRIAAWKR